MKDVIKLTTILHSDAWMLNVEVESVIARHKKVGKRADRLIDNMYKTLSEINNSLTLLRLKP